MYTNLGEPETEEVTTCDGEPLPPCVPAELVAPIDISAATDASFLQESVILADFGQSYAIASPPSDYEPATVLNYYPPEVRFEGRATFEADVWMLGCAIFEIRTGAALFSSFFGSDTDILRQTVQMLGRLPDPWWAAFKERTMWFEEDGEPKTMEEQESAGVLLKASKSSLREQLQLIGTQDEAPSVDEGPMLEKTGARLLEKEVELPGDLLEKTLKYRPEEGIRMDEVVEHPWFAFSD